nr:MAG TPA: nucelotide kinase [Caudoviricetes sp.]
MIYKFDYTGPDKEPRNAEIRVSSDDPRSLETLAEVAYRNKYGSGLIFDSYAAFSVNEVNGLGDPGTDADGGAKGPKPSMLDFLRHVGIDWHVNPDTNTISFYEGDLDSIEYDKPDEETKFYDGDEDGKAKEIISEAFEDIDRPDRYLQGEIDLIDAAYLLFPWDQFKGFMKITIMRYTLRYEHKGWLKDLDKITVYTRRLKELEVKNKDREDRKNEKV